MSPVWDGIGVGWPWTTSGGLHLGFTWSPARPTTHSASAWFRDRRVGDGGRCVWIHEVQLGNIGVVVVVRVGHGYRVQHGEVDGRPGTRAVRTALDGDGSPPLPRLGVRMG